MCKPGESCLGCCHAGVFYVYNNAPPVMDLLLCRYNYAKEYFCWLNIEFFFSLIFPSKTPSPIWPSCTLSASRVHYSWLFGLLGVCLRVIILSKGSFVWNRRTVFTHQPWAANREIIPKYRLHIFTLFTHLLLECLGAGCLDAVFWHLFSEKMTSEHLGFMMNCWSVSYLYLYALWKAI